MNQDKKLTIDEIAKLCGVSKTSISRYLNGKYENLSADTRERIAAVIDETHYRPNRSAQRLKASKSKLIGCVIGDVSSPFSSLLLRGITGSCDKAGYQVLIADCNDQPAREKSAIEGFLENNVDGLIVNTSGGNDSFLLELQNRRIPIVLADRELMTGGKMDTVTSANREVAKQCIEYLHSCGYEKVAFFSEGNKMISPRVRRCEGYLDGLRQYYEDTTPYIYEFDKNIDEDCRRMLLSFLEQFPDRRRAVFAVNGVTCQHVLFAANELGIRFGRDIGLCSFDDWSWLQLAPPGITSIKNETELTGSESARLLLEKINGVRGPEAEPVCIETPSTLVKRGSTEK